MPQRPIITFTTDFGTNDHFAAVMKGVILTLNPDAQIVDICNHVAPYDLFDAAYSLVQSYSFFPNGTIHLAIVDPGVGTARRPILASTGQHTFVAPDNGVLSLIFEREPGAEVRHITADHYFLNPVSNTFQGRDIFAPVAAWLSKGIPVDKFGDPVTDFTKFNSPKPKRVSERLITGVTLKADRFGNLITNITPQDVPELFSENPPPFKIMINQHEITHFNMNYSAAKPSELFAIVGSAGFIEICMNRASAAKMLNANRGVEVGVIISEGTAT